MLYPIRPPCGHPRVQAVGTGGSLSESNTGARRESTEPAPAVRVVTEGFGESDCSTLGKLVCSIRVHACPAAASQGRVAGELRWGAGVGSAAGGR